MYLSGERIFWSQSRDFPETMERKENYGFLYGIGATGKWNMPSRLTFSVTSEMKGNRFDDARFDSNDNVEFLMIKVTGDLGLIFKVTDRSSVSPLVGFGYRRWLRDVEEYSPYLGYVQIWRSHFFKAGMEAEHDLSKNMSTFVNAGAFIPVSSRMKREKDGYTCTVNYDNSMSGFGAFGASYNKFRWSLYYEGLRFAESNDKCNGHGEPESKADMFGIKLAIVI